MANSIFFVQVPDNTPCYVFFSNQGACHLPSPMIQDIEKNFGRSPFEAHDRAIITRWTYCSQICGVSFEKGGNYWQDV